MNLMAKQRKIAEGSLGVQPLVKCRKESPDLKFNTERVKEAARWGYGVKYIWKTGSKHIVDSKGKSPLLN